MPADCGASTCVETCECQEGFVLDAGKCIPQAECGCVFEGRLYGLGEEFWGDNTCTKRCVCDAATRTAVCRKASCRAREECRVEQGIQDCYPTSYGNCTAYGTTHYKDFDGGRFIFQGTCVYQFTGLCKKTQDLVDFQVLVQNGQHNSQLLSSIALVKVKVYGKSIVISKKDPNKITVSLANFVPFLHSLPAPHPSLLFPFSLFHLHASFLPPLLDNAEYSSPTMLLISRATRSDFPGKFN